MKAFFTSLSLTVALCLESSAVDSLQYASTPIVSVSARGWTIKPGSPANGTLRPTTIVVNPDGVEFNIGTTSFPDFLPATLWIIEVKELEARFLIIRIPPVASGAMEMPVLYINAMNKPTLAGTIRHRFEFSANPDDKPGFDPRIRWDGEHRLKDILFKDSDGDHIPELQENQIWKDGGTVTYFTFTKQKTFVPLWKETWTLGTNTHIRVTRTRVETATR